MLSWFYLESSGGFPGQCNSHEPQMTRISRTENSTNLSELQGGSGAYFHVLMPLLSRLCTLASMNACICFSRRLWGGGVYIPIVCGFQVNCWWGGVSLAESMFSGSWHHFWGKHKTAASYTSLISKRGISNRPLYQLISRPLS